MKLSIVGIDNKYKDVVSIVLTGATAGGLNGVYMGLKETKASQLTGAVKRTQ